MTEKLNNFHKQLKAYVPFTLSVRHSNIICCIQRQIGQQPMKISSLCIAQYQCPPLQTFSLELTEEMMSPGECLSGKSCQGLKLQ